VGTGTPLATSHPLGAEVPSASRSLRLRAQTCRLWRLVPHLLILEPECLVPTLLFYETIAELNAALVETWHDDGYSPDLIACAPPGFRYIKKTLRRTKMSTATNHGSICLLYERTLNVRVIQLPSFTMFCGRLHVRPPGQVSTL